MGIVYFIQAGVDGPIKIGYCNSEWSVSRRCAALQTGNPHPLRVTRIIAASAVEEAELHERFADARLEGEWFIPTAALAEIAEADRDENADLEASQRALVREQAYGRGFARGYLAGRDEALGDAQFALRRLANRAVVVPEPEDFS